MCGIAGVLRFGGAPAAQGEVRAMVAALRHRGPDDEGHVAVGGAAVGMRRLAVIDVGPGGHQPATNERGTVHVVFNGEIYNHRDLRSRLLASGHRFTGRSDTEVLVHGYEEFGALGLVKRLEGMFAFALLDSERRRAFLARDPFGVKPLYLRRGPGRLSFCSELRALWLDGGGRPGVDPGFLSSYLRVGYIPSPRTAFHGVSRLEPATLLEVDLVTGEERPGVFYRLGEGLRRDLEGRPLSELEEELASALDLAVRRQLVSDVPLGVFLSGGLDSSSIALVASRHLDEPTRTFSVGFEASDRGDETGAAAGIARALGARNTAVLLGPGSLSDLAAAVESLEEPLGDSAVLPLWTLCRAARRDVAVALSGEGGDEALGGYGRYYWGALADRLSGHELPGLALLRRAGRLPDRTRGFLNLFRRARKFADTIALPEAARYLGWFDLFSAPERAALLDGAAAQDGSWIEARVEKLFAEARQLELDPVQRLQFVDVRTFLIDNLLLKSDRLSMAHGLEVRVPLIDQPLLELGLSLPARAKISFREDKVLLRRLLRRDLRAIAGRPKRGFEPPVDAWLARSGPGDPLAELQRGALVSALGFSAPAIGDVIDRHRAGNHAGRAIYALLALELWARRYAT